MSDFQFSIDETDQDEGVTLFLSGSIDDGADFSAIKLNFEGPLHVNFSKVVTINSFGIRDWIRWINSDCLDRKIILHECPKTVVDQINNVVGFLPKQGAVESFYVPYFCPELGTEKSVLFKRGQEFEDNKVSPPEKIVCDETQRAMEIDVIEAKYFKFLQAG